MAATLAWIKSRMLLPPDGLEPEGEGPDPRAELVARLLEYQRFKQAAGELAERRWLGRDVFEAHVVPQEPRPGIGARDRGRAVRADRGLPARARARGAERGAARGRGRDGDRARAHARRDAGARAAAVARVHGVSAGERRRAAEPTSCSSRPSSRSSSSRASRRCASTRGSTSGAGRAGRSTCAARRSRAAEPGPSRSPRSCEESAMERSEQRSIAEALILASPEPIPLARLVVADPELSAGAGARAGGRAERRVRRARTRLRDLGGRGRLPAPHAAGLRRLRAGEPARATAAAVPRRARDARGGRLPAAGDARRDRARARRRRRRRAAQPARASPGADRGASRGAGPAAALRDEPPLPRDLRAGADRGPADAARAGRARARGAGAARTPTLGVGEGSGAAASPRASRATATRRAATTTRRRRATTTRIRDDDADLDDDDWTTRTTSRTASRTRPRAGPRPTPQRCASALRSAAAASGIPPEKLGKHLRKFP